VDWLQTIAAYSFCGGMKSSQVFLKGGQVAARLAAGDVLREVGFLTITDSGGQSALALRPGRRHSIVNYALIRALPSFA
jgi:hypothetical protein